MRVTRGGLALAGALLAAAAAGGAVVALLLPQASESSAKSQPVPAAKTPPSAPPSLPAQKTDPAPAAPKPTVVSEKSAPASAAKPAPKPTAGPPVAAPSPDAKATLYFEVVAPPKQEDRTVTVLVQDAAEAPIQGALVVVRQAGNLLYQDRTDEQGLVSFVPYPSETGPFEIAAAAFGYDSGTKDSVADGAKVTLTLEARSEIAGRVVAPVRGKGTVTLFTATDEITHKIAPDGTFLFRDLQEGPVTVQATVPPYGSASEQFYLQASVRQNLRLHVRAQNPAGIHGKIVLWPGKGHVFIDGLPVAVAEDGSFQFGKAIVGTNEILIDAPGKALVRERFDVSGAQFHAARFTLQREGVIQGRVRDAATRRPVAGAVVRLGVNFGDPRNDRVPLFPIERVPVVRTDSQGRFKIHRLDLRLIYLVSVVAPGYGQYLHEAVPDGGVLDVGMPAGPFVYGKVRGIGGVPRGAVVTARPVGGDSSKVRFNVSGWDDSKSGRDIDSNYGLGGLVAGTYLVRADAPGFAPVETVVQVAQGDRLRVDLRLRYGELPNTEPGLAELLNRLPPSLETTQQQTTGAPARTEVDVDLSRPDTEPLIPMVTVKFYKGGEEFAAPEDHDEKTFTVYGLPEGSYQAILTIPGQPKPIVKTFVLSRTKPISLDFK